MAIGETINSEWAGFEDPHTGAVVRQLTNHRSHSHHLYFTNSGLWEGGKRLLLVSDRNNATNLYSVDLRDGRITQLTDYPPDAKLQLQRVCVNPVRNEAYFTLNRELICLNLTTCEQRPLYRLPEGYDSTIWNCTADGVNVCTALCQDLSHKIKMDLQHGYVGFAEYSAARPDCRIIAVSTNTGDSRILHEEDFWLNHVNTSPTLPDILTFCHEGPWETVSQRIWTLNVSTGEVKPLRKQSPGERIGHEYWFADGKRVGFHGWTEGAHRFGWIRWDESKLQEWDFPYGSTHFHSIDETLIVGDGTRYIPHGPDKAYLLLWRLREDEYDGPRRLGGHRGSFHIQRLHVHPRMFRDCDGQLRVVYTADPQGYGNVYIVEVPDFESLPEVRQNPGD